MSDVFIAKGHGYEIGSRGRCTAFDGYTVIANPMGGNDAAGRASRCGGPFRCDYQSHVIQLATRDADHRREGAEPDLYILMHHGGGREVLRIPSFADRGAFAAALLAMPEAVQYATLYTMYSIASEAARQEGARTRTEWGMAILEKRIRTKRKGGRTTVSVETQFEKDLRLGIVKPTAVSIDIATGQIEPVDA